MSELVLVRNQLLVVTGAAERTVRLLWSEPTRIAEPRWSVIDMHASHPWPEWWSAHELLSGLNEDSYQIIPANPRTTLRTRGEEDLTDTDREVRRGRFEAIRDLVEDPEQRILYAEERGALIRKASAKHTYTPTSIRHFLRLYWQGGQTPNALLPRYLNCGGPGTSRVTEDSARRPKRGRPRTLVEGKEHEKGTNCDRRAVASIVLGAKEFHEKEGLPLSKAYLRTLGKYFVQRHEIGADGRIVPIPLDDSERPSFEQFTYHYEQAKAQDRQRSAIQKQGQRRFSLRSRPLIGDPRQHALAPGSRYEVDTTIGDIALVSSMRRTRGVGRPIIYIVRDAFSRMVVGFHVALDGPNWTGLKMALFSAFTDKVAFCRRLGREIKPEEWLCTYLPDAMLGDRGPAELMSRHLDFFINTLHVRVDNAAPSRADWKPFVERFFRIMNDEGVRWVPGAIHGPRERGDRDPRMDAVHTVQSFSRLLLEIILCYNNTHWISDYEPDAEIAQDGVPLIPAELWKWGLRNRSGCLRTADPEELRLSLMRSVELTVGRRGLFLPTLNLHYTCDEAEEKGWFVAEQGRQWPRIQGGIDERDVSDLHLRLDGGRTLVKCTLLDRFNRYRGATWDEVHDERAYLSALEKAARRGSVKDDLAHMAIIDQLNHEAAEAQSVAIREEGSGPTVKDLRANRLEESTRIQKEGVAAERAGIPQQVSRNPESETGGEDEPVPGASEISLLREALDES